MSHAGRNRVNQSRWQDQWLLSAPQALAMLTFSISFRRIVL
jgi:hypothetical protein